MKDISGLVGELRMMKDFDIKPNFSDLSRKYGIDRHTIKKYYEKGGVPIRKSYRKKSKWDGFENEIVELMSMPHVSKRGVYRYLYNKYRDSLPGNYNSFCGYTWRRDIHLKPKSKPHPLYEVDPGYQLQCDWKENLELHLKNGELITFNVFSATLGFSREHVFIYSSTKTTDDFLRCTIEVFRRLGGVTETFFTDNMTAIVSVRGKDKTVNPKVIQFFKDINCKLILAKIKTPQTKGKDENANKFVKWIYPYDYKLESEAEIIALIEDSITRDANNQINTGTGLPPATLFKKEKEYLKPLSHKVLLDSYLEEHIRQKADATLLVYYKGSRYSVPPAYKDELVDIYPIDGCIYIYHKNKLIAKHNITQNRVQYNPKHYKEALKTNISHLEEDKIEQMAESNLKKLEMIGMK